MINSSRERERTFFFVSNQTRREIPKPKPTSAMNTNCDHDLYHDLNLKRRRPLNLVKGLIGREFGSHSSTLYTTCLFTEHANRNEAIALNQLKRSYLSITPNYSILNVKVPNCFLRRFSPDGRYLIAFNYNQNGIQIYEFNGSGSAVKDIEYIHDTYSKKNFNSNQSPNGSFGQSRPDKTEFSDYESDQLRFRAFELFFKERANLRLTENNEQIHRECALFYESTHLIAASSVACEELLPVEDATSASNNESIDYSIVENYTIYLIDIKNARVCDKLKFNSEKINLAHNQSLGLFQDTFAVLTQKSQTVHIYKIKEEIDETSKFKSALKFVNVQQIGRFCYPDDLEFVQNSTKDQSGKIRINSNLQIRFFNQSLTQIKNKV